MVPLVYLIGLIAMVFTALAYAQMARVVPARRVGVLLRRPRNPPRRRLLRGLGDPARLPAGADAAVRVRRGVDDRPVPGHAAVAVGDRVRHRQHGDQPARRRLAEDGQPRVPGHRTGLRRRSSCYIAVRAISGGSLPDVGWSTTPIWNSGARQRAVDRVGAVSIAVLSFLGFDGISTLAEERTGSQNPHHRQGDDRGAGPRRGRAVHRADVAGQPARRRPRVVQRRRGGQRVLQTGRSRIEHRVDERILRRQRARRRIRQRHGRPGGDQPAAVLDEPRPPASRIPVQDQRSPGPDQRDPGGERESASYSCCSSSVRSG